MRTATACRGMVGFRCANRDGLQCRLFSDLTDLARCWIASCSPQRLAGGGQYFSDESHAALVAAPILCFYPSFLRIPPARTAILWNRNGPRLGNGALDVGNTHGRYSQKIYALRRPILGRARFLGFAFRRSLLCRHELGYAGASRPRPRQGSALHPPKGMIPFGILFCLRRFWQHFLFFRNAQQESSRHHGGVDSGEKRTLFRR